MTIPDPNDLALTNSADNALAHVGLVANHYAAQNVFADYLSRQADNTIRRQAADLTRFVEFLNQVGEQAGLQLGASPAAPITPTRAPCREPIRAYLSYVRLWRMPMVACSH